MKTDQDLRAKSGASRLGKCVASVLMGILLSGVAACADDDDDVVGVSSVPLYDQYYSYGYYYPADLAYSSAYWADSWDYGGLYYYSKATESQALTSDRRLTGLGSAIRNAARGNDVCPGHVTVTPKTAAPACTGGVLGNVRTGVTITFDGCVLANGGGTISGTYDVQSTRTVSQPTCTSSTNVNLAWTATITNLTYTGPDGRKIVIPSQTDMGSAAYPYGTLPSSLTINSTGRIQIFGADGAVVSDRSTSGTRTFSFGGGARTYTIDGSIDANDTGGVGKAQVSASGLKRDDSCCRPIGGSLTVNRTAGDQTGTHTWVFGPACGATTYDGAALTLPDCP